MQNISLAMIYSTPYFDIGDLYIKMMYYSRGEVDFGVDYIYCTVYKEKHFGEYKVIIKRNY